MEKQAYTVREIAGLTGFSQQTVPRIFQRERGVIVVERPESMRKRSYRSIRVPKSVFERVIRGMTV